MGDRTRLPRPRVPVHTRHAAAADHAWALAAGCDAALHETGSADALVREVHRLDGADLVEPLIEPGSGRPGTGDPP
jgi:hypothetical protein